VYQLHVDDCFIVNVLLVAVPCRYSLAPARAYVESIDELFALRQQGFVQAGAEDLFLIAAGDRWCGTF
jgi:hypothetical protein